jgi:O-antigen ligase
MILIVISGGLLGVQGYKTHKGEEYVQARAGAMTSMERPASGRLTVWQDALSHVWSDPILGTGIKGARHLSIRKSDDKTVIHVHNAILEIFLETGLVGLALFAITILLFVYRFLQAYIHLPRNIIKAQSMAIFLSAIAYGVASMALTSMFHAWWFLYLVILLILIKLAENAMKQNACNGKSNDVI